MEITQWIVILVCTIVMAIGVVCVYNARELTQKFFSSSEQNTVTQYLKIIGAILSIGVALFILWFLI